MKRIILSLIALAITTMASAFSFSATVGSGQTLYFTIMGQDSVKVVPPMPVGWEGYTAPEGDLVIPSTINNNGTTYRVTVIDRMAFQDCNGLTTVIVPGSVLSIGQRAFAQDTMLRKVVLDEGVQRIDMMAFVSCTSLDTIELPSTLRRIAVSAFENTAYYNNLDNWSSEKVLTLGQWVIKVGNLTEGTVHVHEGVMGVANSAFLYCRYMDMVVLPSTMRIIGEGAFKDCYALDTVRLLSMLPPSLSDDSFEGVEPLPTLVVPCSTVAVYTASNYWSSFPIVEAPCPQGVDEVEPEVAVKVLQVQGGVVVLNAGGSSLTVCDMMGRQVCVKAHADEYQYIALPTAGVYVLRTEGEAVKISYCK